MPQSLEKHSANRYIQVVFTNAFTNGFVFTNACHSCQSGMWLQYTSCIPLPVCFVQRRTFKFEIPALTLLTTTPSALHATIYDPIHTRTTHPNTYAIFHTPPSPQHSSDKRTNHPSTPTSCAITY